MLDANDIQIISKIVSDALAEERKHTEAMFVEERKHTEAMFAAQKEEIRAEMLAISAKQKEEIHAEMLAISAKQKEEIHAEMLAISAKQKEEIHADMLAISAKQKEEIHADMMTIIESEVSPKLRILAEGHEALLERMTPPEEIADMKADIVILKEAVRSLSMKVNALQKAQ